MDDKLLQALAGAGPENTTVYHGVGADADGIEIAMQALEADAEKAGWDQSPEIYSIFSFPEALGMRTFPVPEDVLGNMSKFLPTFADAIAAMPEAWSAYSKVLPPNFFGIAIMNEAWMVEQATREIEQEWAGRLDEHPDRVEGRFVISYTLDGRMLTVNRVRGRFPMTAEVPPELHSESMIPATLKRIVETCKGLAPSYVMERQLLE